MEGEAGVLQQRVHVLAVQRRRPDAQERVALDQPEQGEAAGRGAQHADHPRPQAGRQAAAEHRDRTAANRQDQAPQQDRALVVAPGSADLVDQRLQAVAVGGDVLHREIVHHRAGDQAGIGRGERDQLAEREGRCGLHQPCVARGGAPQRQRRLREAERHAERQREMPHLRGW
jgi:hypothetical protein